MPSSAWHRGASSIAEQLLFSSLSIPLFSVTTASFFSIGFPVSSTVFTARRLSSG
jgi:hypothetical protein